MKRILFPFVLAAFLVYSAKADPELDRRIEEAKRAKVEAYQQYLAAARVLDELTALAHQQAAPKFIVAPANGPGLTGDLRPQYERFATTPPPSNIIRSTAEADARRHAVEAYKAEHGE